MRPCSCAGINVTWSCNASCLHCFYRRNENLHKPVHMSLLDVIGEMENAKARGCDRIVLIGFGEPLMHPEVAGIVEAAKGLGLKSNIITNGTMPVRRYADVFDAGLNHIQISAHARGDMLDTIMEMPGAGRKQAILLKWLQSEGLPFRTNTSLQRTNYQVLPEIIGNLIEHDAFHIALLGFLPHYEWEGHVDEIAVHPAELRPYIEASADMLLAAGTLFTIRYHPLCHLDEKYWPYVTNACNVLFDPFEWDYDMHGRHIDEIVIEARKMGDSVAVCGEPCDSCAVRIHCGGWNRTYADAFDGAGLKGIEQAPKTLLFNQNPANQHRGYV